MKTLRFTPALLLALALAAGSGPALARSPARSTVQSTAQESFERIKALAGKWEGTLTTVPVTPSYQGKRVRVRLRVTSSGNAVMHEMHMPGQPDDPITMLYVNGDRLFLRHYCDAGNRPRMVAKASPDGKTIAFELLDVSGSKHYGYMEHVVFTTISARHHTEDWTFMEPGEHPTTAHFDLRKVQ